MAILVIKSDLQGSLIKHMNTLFNRWRRGENPTERVRVLPPF